MLLGCWVLTERQEQLARSKKFHPDHTTDRPSPIWCVSRLAKTVQPSQRILELSLPKMAPSNYCLPREVGDLHGCYVTGNSSLATVSLIIPALPTCEEAEAE